MRRHPLTLVVSLALGTLLAAGLAAQPKPALTRADYGQWETLGLAGERTFSPDGAWLAHSISRRNGQNEVRFQKLADGTDTVAAFGAGHVFTADSKWVGYTTGYSETELERMRAARQPVQNKFGLMSLTSGEVTTIDGIQSFSFSGDGKFVALRRYPPTPPGGATGAGSGTEPAPGGGRGRGGANAGGADDAPAVGVTVLVRDLATGRDTTFGNVSEFAWQDDPAGHLLAMAISADGQSGNGVHLFDPESTVLRVLDSAAVAYASLAWRKESKDLAVLKAKADERREGATEIVIAWRGLGTTGERRSELDPTPASGVPAGMRTVTYRRPAWSEDGRTIFLGIADWPERPPSRGRGAAGAGRGAAAGAAPATEPDTAPAGRGNRPPPADEPAGVDIWHWTDSSVLARQKLTAPADRRRNFLSAWHPDDGRFVRLQQSLSETVAPIAGSGWAYVEDGTPYAMERSIGRGAADLQLVDLATGQRTMLKAQANDSTAAVSPGGRYLLYVEGGHYWTMNLETRTATNITRQVRTSFVNGESDSTGPTKPMFGSAGWTTGDQSVILYDKHDVWQISPDGAKSRRLTDGAAEGVRHRLVRLDQTDEFVTGDRYVALFGTTSKKSGYGRLRVPATLDAAASATDRLVWRDESIGNLVKAKNRDVYAYIAQRHDDSPDVFVTDASLGAAKQVTTTNAFQSTYAWSRSEVVDYKSATGQPLQGALYYPAGYQPGRAYPMIVYLYETLSDNVHRYVAPGDRDYYNTTVFTSQGYFVLQPDIVFRPREPGLSVVECVTPAVKRVVDLGLADVKRVGVIGHSWGGFDTAFLSTNTQGVFAAAVAGAAITNLVSNYGNHHWSSGIAETDHIETGQQRMQVPLYDDLQAYIRNSAVYNVHKMTVPLMLMTGDNDGTVYWHQAVEMYNIARRAKKNVVMLVYNGEDHGLRQAKNQIDYQRRILAWFGHYLKGDPAEPWIAQGQSFLDREAEVRRGGGGR